MNKITVDLSATAGRIKPMHAANNGPVFSLKDYNNGTMHPFNSNLELYRAAGFPYARTHDTSFYHRFGLEHVIDVYYIFPNFDADVNDPSSYDFACTDEYIACTYLAGTKIFYRLGHRIEHQVKRYGTLPPKDFKKWAQICEHIVRHYTEGWADGFRYDMEYFEIWAEPDLAANNQDNPCWSGTTELFYEFYDIVAKHLKGCFPDKKFGGPALAGNRAWADRFLAQLKAPLDFLSWHLYTDDPAKITNAAVVYREMLDKYGFTETESILDEWNYLKDSAWNNDSYVYSHKQRRLIKGASFEVAAMCAGQGTSVDMMMYYDVRPNEFWNGVFNDTIVGEVFKGYYPFVMFNELYKHGESAKCTYDGELFAAAARNGDDAVIILTRYSRDDNSTPCEISVDISGILGGATVEWYLLDKENDLKLVNKMKVYSSTLNWLPTLGNFDCYMIKIHSEK